MELIKDFLLGIGINIMEWQTVLFLGLALVVALLIVKR